NGLYYITSSPVCGKKTRRQTFFFSINNHLCPIHSIFIRWGFGFFNNFSPPSYSDDDNPQPFSFYLLHLKRCVPLNYHYRYGFYFHHQRISSPDRKSTRLNSSH